MKIGFLGAGKMGEALIQGALLSLKPDQILFYEWLPQRSVELVQKYGVRAVSKSELIEQSDWIFIAVKPQQFQEAVQDIAPFPDHKLMISMMAGISLKSLTEFGGNWVRIMPNTPILCQAAMIPVCITDERYKQPLWELLSKMGDLLQVPESQMDLLTAMTGSGPAFFYRIADAMIAYAITDGMAEDTATKLVAQTMLGAAKMLKTQGKTAKELIVDVASPNGTTVAGLSIFDQQAIDEKIQNVIHAAQNRSRELSQGSLGRNA